MSTSYVGTLKEMADRGELGNADYQPERLGGPDHATSWSVRVTLPDGRSAMGGGRSVSAAKENAAEALYHTLR